MDLFDNKKASPLAEDETNPFADLDDLDVELALDSLEMTTVRSVYDRQLLRELAPLLPYEVALANRAILLEKQQDGTFFVGMCSHKNLIHLSNVARAMRVSTKALHPRVLLPQRFERLLEEVYDLTVAQSDANSGDDTSDDQQQKSVDWNQFAEVQPEGRFEFDEREIEIGTGTGLRALAERIILNAIGQRASDVHLVPQYQEGYILFRTDGEMYKAYKNIPRPVMENLANAFCDMANVNAYQVAQDEVAREIQINIKTNSGRKDRRTLRFQGIPGQYGRIIVIRIQSNDFRGFHMIGLEESQITQIENSLFHKVGLCLVTGPTGSGKSNTLEAMLRKVEEIRPGRINIIQIGNPIEFPNPEREQIPLKTDEDWDRFFKATLRMDPDILSPGEFRNASEAGIVFQAAATGHLTLTTLHTNNVAQTCSRLDFLGIERDKQSSLLRLIASQELVPLLCPHCKEPDPNGPQIVDHLVNLIFPNRPDLRNALGGAKNLPFYRRVGCRRCNNRGIKLRTCIAEVLTVTPDISLMLRNKVDGQEIVNLAVRRHGMITIAEAAARKLCRGLIDYNDVVHLLMSTNEEAPENTSYSWQTQPIVENDLSTADDSDPDTNDYIDAEVIYEQEEPARVAA